MPQVLTSVVLCRTRVSVGFNFNFDKENFLDVIYVFGVFFLRENICMGVRLPYFAKALTNVGLKPRSKNSVISSLSVMYKGIPLMATFNDFSFGSR